MTTGLRERKAQPATGKAAPQKTDRGSDDLEPYRRLIEIQKQLAEMAKQNEQTKRECDAMREQMVREVVESLGSGAGLRNRIRRSASRLLKRLPGLLASGSHRRNLNRKYPAHVKGH